uniref:Uncharacterized protein n=1 Tax=Siphoviridae sp. ctmYS12 TaxID=2825652 RepID=A0A8S5P7J3_9CAUD|nr:MAG TPA: hypothetical protein [Siphoviridae sp. ctmYS12]
MIKLENVVLASPEQMEFIIEGMRNPMNSWDRSDSTIVKTDHEVDDYIDIGKTDYLLMQRLSKAGTDHRKFMRMMPVYVRITAPLYWWKEFDTYKVGTVSNSCSTMHKIHDKEFTLEDFSTEYLSYPSLKNLKDIIKCMNDYREEYLKDKEKHNWWQMIQLLPSSYNQTRNVMMNYEVLANIYQWRKDHKLDEWREFCKWIEGLPYSELITHPSSPITQAGDIVGRLASAMAAPLNCDGKVDNTRGTGLWQPGDED